MQSRKIKKGGNSKLIDCNAIAQNKKGRKLQFNRLQCNRAKFKKKGRELQFNRLQCNHTK